LRNRRAAAALLACAAALPADAARAGEPTAEPPAAAAAEQPAGSDTSDVFPYPVHRQTLDNGLQVVAVPFASPGVVAYFTVVRTGSRQEVEAGHSGFAHFFEHVMFRGTERYPSEVYNDVLKRMGADSNAFTTDDYTLYYIVGPAADLETMMDIESDRFENLSYGEEAFRTEALAVLGEYNKNASNPVWPMWEKLRATAFTRHTYRHTTLGFLEDIEAMPGYYDYSLGFFDRFYRPENTILLVVGDVDPERVAALARRFYGDWKKGYKPADIPAEPPQTEPREASIDWPGPTRPQLMFGYHSPAFGGNVETAALDLIDQLLTSESADLYRQVVVDEQWADQLSSFWDYQRDPALYSVYARVKSDELVPRVRSAIEAAVAELAAEPVDAARLGRIKSHLRYGFALGLTSPAAVGFRLAEFLELTGDVGSIGELFAAYDRVTPAELQRVAATVFRDANRTVVTLAHRPPAPAEEPAEGAGEAEAPQEGER
jgi:zinc protease